MKNRTWLRLVKILPNKLVYHCFMHVFAYSTMGKYGATEVPGITAMEAIQRYDKDKNITGGK